MPGISPIFKYAKQKPVWCKAVLVPLNGWLNESNLMLSLDIEENGLINLVSCAAVHSLRPERYNSCTEVRQAAALYNITGSLLMSIYLTCKLCKLENF